MSIQQRNLEATQHFALAPTATRSTTFTGATVNVIGLHALDGDIQVIGAIIYIWADGGWKQIYPAIYT